MALIGPELPNRLSRPSLGAVEALRREASAFARVASLLPRDTRPVVPRQAGPGDDVVVLVHGLMATAGVMRPMREHVESAAGAHTATFTYRPGVGVPRVASELDRLLARLPPGVRVHLVGHSLGGLAVRWYVQETAGDARVVQTIAVAAPFEGARGARWLPGEAGRQLCEGSEVLRRLGETASRAALPHLSISGTADRAIVHSTRFAVGDRLVIPGLSHNELLFHPAVAEVVVNRIVAARAWGATTSP